MKNSALYVHIPFCDHKCIYCDFYSIITKDNIKPFLSSIKKEISNYSDKYRADRSFFSIFFGGGTPSLMEPEYIGEIITELKDKFIITPDAEITLETNPGTVKMEKLEAFRNAGINRISIGIQSFDDKDLSFLTRIHNKQTAVDTVNNAKDAGFNNISVDLIFNLPEQTKEKWLKNLQEAVKLPVRHISAYSLILERGTILNKLVLDGKVTIQDDDYDAELYQATIDFLKSEGFIQYEVSNFAKPGFESRHNNAYWRYNDYLSFGPSAHSFMNGKRWWNYSSLKRYINEVAQNSHARSGDEIITPEQKFEEYVMLALRSKGIDIPEFKSLFGDKWLIEHTNYFSELEQKGFVSINKNLINLTGPGYAVCDEILSKIL